MKQHISDGDNCSEHVDEKAHGLLAAREPHLPPRGMWTLADIYDPLAITGSVNRIVMFYCALSCQCNSHARHSIKVISFVPFRLRGSPKRRYGATAAGRKFQATFTRHNVSG